MPLPHALSSRIAAGGLDDLWATAGNSADAPIDVVDLFSGAGGMSAGFLAMNASESIYHILFGLDVDPGANRTYETNIGAPALTTDVRHFVEHPEQFKAQLALAGRDTSKPLVMIGCAPCQGFSSHRNSGGTGDLRNSLVADFARLAAAVKPEVVIAENVPELLTDRHWPEVALARQILLDAGYHVHMSIHNMAEFGVPQERFRALMVASKVPFAPVRGDVRRGDFRTVRDAIGDLPAIFAGERDSTDVAHFTANHRASTIATIRRVPKNGGNRPADAGPESLRRLHMRQGKAAYEDVYGRLAWDKPSITVTAYSRNPASGRFVHPEQDRGLSVREAALLQSFPSSYQFSGTFDEMFRQIGNAVPPVFAAKLARHIREQLLRPTGEAGDYGISQPIGASFARLIPSLKSRASVPEKSSSEAKVRS